MGSCWISSGKWGNRRKKKEERGAGLDCSGSSINHLDIWCRAGQKEERNRVFNLARVTWQVGRPAEEDSRTERAGSQMNLSHCLRFNGYAPTLYSFPVFRRYFRWQILSCRTMWSPSLNAPAPADVPARPVIFDIVSRKRARGHIGIANVPVYRNLMKT